MWYFPKIRATFLGVTRIRIIVHLGKLPCVTVITMEGSTKGLAFTDCPSRGAVGL